MQYYYYVLLYIYLRIIIKKMFMYYIIIQKKQIELNKKIYCIKKLIGLGIVFKQIIIYANIRQK